MLTKIKLMKNTTPGLKLNEFANATYTNNSLKKTSLLLLAVFLMGWNVSWGQTPYPMSSGNYSENFADIVNWGNNFVSGTGANRWASYPTTAGGSANDGVRTTKSSATFASNTAGGIQKGTENLVFLSTGSSPTSQAVAINLLLDFTGRNAGTLSFDWVAIDNGSGTRPTSLRVFWSTDNSTFTEITAAQVIDIQSVNFGSITTVALPANFNNSASARLRFYNHAGTSTGSGNRDKISLDNLSITSTSINFYSKSTGNLENTATWTDDITLVAGAAPTDFTSNNQIFNIRNNATPTIGAAWTVSGTGSSIVVGDGTNACNFTIPASFAVTGAIEVAAAATLLLNANANLTVTGVLTNNGTITLSSGATLVQGASSTVAGSGTWNVNQAVVGSGTSSSVTGRFYYMGSPVATSTTNVLNPSAANRVWSYSESAAAFTEITGSSTALTVGQGYGTIFGANQTVNFTGGAINNSDITVSGLTKTGTSGTSGFNMVSNPYPSYLDWDAITKTNIEPTIWFQTKDGSNAKVFDIYSTTSGITISNSGTTVNQYIAPMQGYWTRVSTGTGSLAMTNSMRSHQSASSGLKTQATDFPIFVRLNLKSGQRNDQAVIFFDKNAANTKDAFDSEKMSVSGASQLYSVIENTKVAINGLNYTSGTAYSVPLTAVFNSDNEFSIEGTEVHVVSGMVYLEDKLMQTMSNLSNNASYTFMAAAGVVEDRFVLHFQPSNALSIDELTKDKITITADMSGNVSVVLNNLLSTEGVITVIDFAGRVLSTSVITQTSTKLKVTEAAGIYFVRVSNQNNIKTERIIISK